MQPGNNVLVVPLDWVVSLAVCLMTSRGYEFSAALDAAASQLTDAQGVLDGTERRAAVRASGDQTEVVKWWVDPTSRQVVFVGPDSRDPEDGDDPGSSSAELAPPIADAVEPAAAEPERGRRDLEESPDVRIQAACEQMEAALRHLEAASRALEFAVRPRHGRGDDAMRVLDATLTVGAAIGRLRPVHRRLAGAWIACDGVYVHSGEGENAPICAKARGHRGACMDEFGLEWQDNLRAFRPADDKPDESTPHGGE